MPPPLPATPPPPAPAAEPKAQPVPPVNVAQEQERWHEAMDVAHGKADAREENAEDESWKLIDFGDAAGKPESGHGGKK
jgi:hypothetical protein